MSTSQTCYELKHVEGGAAEPSFRDVVANGLGSQPKSLPCRFLYDERGSHLFEEICEQPEYYPTDCEMEILENKAPEIVQGDLRSIIELGSGSARKARVLVAAALKEYETFDYHPIDVSKAALDMCGQGLVEEFAGVRVTAYCGVYEPALQLAVKESAEPSCVLWLGGSIGNMHRREATAFLRKVRELLRPRDRMLVGVDLRKDAATLNAAYNDANGVTAEFNLNILHRINRELGGDFDVSKFRHDAAFNSDEGRIEIHIESLEAQRVRIEKIDLDVNFAAGEKVHTENSYKYTREQIEEVAQSAGFQLSRHWLDGEERYSLNELSVI